MYKIMIIDDEILDRMKIFENFFSNKSLYENRRLSEMQKKEYERISFGEFEICYPLESDGSLQEYIEQHKVDAYFLDVYYDEISDWSLGGIFKDIKYNHPEAPIFIYSMDWKDKSVLDTVTRAFRNSFPGKTATYFYDLRQMISLAENFKEAVSKTQIQKMGQERKFIKKMIDQSCGRTIERPYSPQGDVVILHISDIQYGDTNTTDYKNNIWREVSDVCNKLKSEKEISGIDLLAITGDITMHGRQEEMDMAQSDLKYLFKGLWEDEYEKGDYKERILIVPGNHDFDLNYCVLDYFNATNEKDKRSINFNNIAEELAEETRHIKNDYHLYGWSAYKDFVYGVTNNSIIYQRAHSHLNYINNRFVNWNLQFICLNTCDGITAEKTNGVRLDENEIQNILNNNKEKGHYTIVLSHHSPLIMDTLEEDDKKRFESQYNSIIHSCQAQLWLSGHRHIHVKSKKKLLSDSCRVYESATIRLDEDWGEDSEYTVETEKGEITSHRGFQIIKLEKKNNGFIPHLIKYVFNDEGIACRVED